MDIYYTDQKVKSLFEKHLGMADISVKKIVSNFDIQEQFKNSGVKSNVHNFENNLKTDETGKNIEYANLLSRNLKNQSFSKYLKFIGVQQSLMLLNPRMNYFLNTFVIPSFSNPNGIIHHSFDGIILNYVQQVTLPEITKDSHFGAAMGTNIGQIEGSDFQQKSSVANGVQNTFNNILNSLSNNTVTYDPTKAKLIDRLQNFNKINSETQNVQNSFLALNGGGNVENFKFEPRGDANKLGFITENKEKFDELKKLGFDFQQDYIDFGSEEAFKNWLTLNLKSSKTSAGVKWNSDDSHIGYFGNYKITGQEQTSNEKQTRNIVKSDNSDSVAELFQDQQFPFLFEEVGDLNPSWCILPATIKTLSDSFTPSFQEGNNYVGRTEKPAFYSGTQRSITFSLVLYVEHPKYLKLYKDRIAWLTKRTYAKYHEDISKSTGLMTIYKNPPLLRFTLGDLYYRLGGYFSQLSITWGGDQNMWEKSFKGSRIPLMAELNLTYNVLHDEVPDGNTQFWSEF